VVSPGSQETKREQAEPNGESAVEMVEGWEKKENASMRGGCWAKGGPDNHKEYRKRTKNGNRVHVGERRAAPLKRVCSRKKAPFNEQMKSTWGRCMVKRKSR